MPGQVQFEWLDAFGAQGIRLRPSRGNPGGVALAIDIDRGNGVTKTRRHQGPTTGDELWADYLVVSATS